MTCIRKVPGLNLARDTEYSGMLRGFPQFLDIILGLYYLHTIYRWIISSPFPIVLHNLFFVGCFQVLLLCNMAEPRHFWRMQSPVGPLVPLPNRSVAKCVASSNVAVLVLCHRQLEGSECRRRETGRVYRGLSCFTEQSSDRGYFLLNPYPTKKPRPNVLRYINCVSRNAWLNAQRHRMHCARLTALRNVGLAVQVHHVQSCRVIYTPPETARTRRGSLHGLTFRNFASYI